MKNLGEYKSTPKLSYVLTTFNKLPYLKMVMDLLLRNAGIDEEIVLIDGGSTDGTKQYLDHLHGQGLIQQFISEKDRGEAHGFNKGILLAKGELIKLISDDDVFYYPAIRACRKFMEGNSTVDVLVGNTGMADSGERRPPFLNPEMKSEFEKWTNGTNSTFYCNGLPLMLRRNSIPLLGMFNTQFVCVDLEYTIRTGAIANYAFALQYIATRIVNPGSNGNKFALRCRHEQQQLCEMYDYPLPPSWSGEEPKPERSTWWRLKNYVNTKRIALLKLAAPNETIVEESENVSAPVNIHEVYAYHLAQLELLNKEIEPSFLVKNSLVHA